MITTRQILKAIDCPILNLYKGEGYYYFVYDDLARGVYDSRSVYAYRLNHLSFDRWVEEGRDFVKNCQ